MATSSPAADHSDKPSSPLPQLDHPDESTLRGVETADEAKESEAVAQEVLDEVKPSSPLPPLDHPDESTLRGVEKADEVKESEAVAQEVLDEVMRIKAILIIPDQSVDVLFDSLTILQQTKITVDVLQTTMIGKAVSALRKHKAKKIRRFVRFLILDWRAIVDEWVAANPSVEVQEEASSAAEKEASPAKGVAVAEEETEQAEPVLAQSDPKHDLDASSTAMENLDLLGSTLLDNIAAAVVHFYPRPRAAFYHPLTMFEKEIIADDFAAHM